MNEVNLYAERKECVGNIDVKKLILNEIGLNRQKYELAQADYYKATLNHNYESVNKSSDNMAYLKGVGYGLTYALRCCLAQEAEASGRRVSASMKEFDEVVEELICGK